MLPYYRIKVNLTINIVKTEKRTIIPTMPLKGISQATDAEAAFVRTTEQYKIVPGQIPTPDDIREVADILSQGHDAMAKAEFDGPNKEREAENFSRRVRGHMTGKHGLPKDLGVTTRTEGDVSQVIVYHRRERI